MLSRWHMMTAVRFAYSAPLHCSVIKFRVWVLPPSCLWSVCCAWYHMIRIEMHSQYTIRLRVQAFVCLVYEYTYDIIVLRRS